MILYPNSSQTLVLPAGQVLSVAASSGTTGSVVRLATAPGGGDSQSVTAIAGANLSFGSYAQAERFNIICTAGAVTVTYAVPDPTLVQLDTEATTALALKADKVTAATPAGYVAELDADGNITKSTKLASAIHSNATDHASGSDDQDLSGYAPLASPTFTGTVGAANISPTILCLAEKTPVNAVAATKVLTFAGGNALNNENVSIGGQVYTFQTAIQAAGVAATGALTTTGNAVENEVVVIGSRTYRWRTALAAVAATKDCLFSAVAANGETITIDTTAYTFVTALTEAKATGVLTATANTQDGARVTIGSTTYTYRDTLVSAYDVKIGATAEESLLNLVEAITFDAGAGTNEGTDYGTGTVAHPTVTAAEGAGDTVDVTALAIGTGGNAVTSTEFSPGLSWGAGTLTGGLNAVANEVLVEATAEAEIDNLVAAANAGAGEGTKYSTGQAAHTTVTVTKKDADEITATAATVGTAGNSIAIAETCAQVAWAGGATFLSGGYAAAVANDVVVGGSAELSIDNLVLAVNYGVAGNGAGEGTNYATGTTIHADVAGSKTAANVFTATAKVAGEAGNALDSTTTMTNATWAATDLAGGEGIEVANDVLIGGSAELSIDNLVLAIMAGAGAGTNYGTGTAANASVTAVKTDTDKVTCTAKVKGTSGNAVALAENLTNASWAGAATFLSGGVDGTVGVANETCADGSYLYHCLTTNTAADTNWRRFTVGSVY